ncbi:MAG TPA: hypothetical protein VLF91_04555 [Candidatus Saccharimonadales bacterium]|nr:hypothetical protein [Candidatus Saccharimonadales bacterium]
MSAQQVERRQTQHDTRAFFARFARQRPVSSNTLGNKIQASTATDTEKLTSLAEGARDNLFVARTVFPFMLFADTIKIDRQKVTIVHNDFFWKSQTASTEIKNIMNIAANVGPLFGSVTVTSKHFLNNTQTIRYLKRSDAATAQRLLQGFMIAQRAKINTDDIDKKRLLGLLNELGQENRR